MGPTDSTLLARVMAPKRRQAITWTNDDPANTLRPRQNGRKPPDHIFQFHFIEWIYKNFD